MADRISIVGELISAAERLVAASKPVYVHDPKHESRPRGGGWHRTPHGWSNIPKTRMAPISFDDDSEPKKPVEKKPAPAPRKNTIPRTKLAPISFDDDEEDAVPAKPVERPPVQRIEQKPVEKPTAPPVVQKPARMKNMPEIPAPSTKSQEATYSKTKEVCSSLLNNGADIDKAYLLLTGDGYGIRFNMEGIPSRCFVTNEFNFRSGNYYRSCKFLQGSKNVGFSVDSFMQNRIRPSEKELPFEQTRKDLGGFLESKGWSIDEISRDDDGTVSCSMYRKAYGDGYDARLKIENGEVVDSENFSMDDDMNIFCKSHGLKNLEVYGYAD